MRNFISNYVCIFLLLSLFFISKNSNAQSHSVDVNQYDKIFGKSYSQARVFLIANKWMKDTLQKRGIDPEFALAIIFPELIRYSSLFDVIEISALKTLYLQFGKSYSNFSVGRFQMKPSFAENIENDWNLIEAKPKSLKNIVFDTNDNLENRKARLQRIENIHGQLLYLSLFFYIVKSRHPIEFKRKEDMLLFYATAYNFSYRVSSTEVISNIYKRRFHTDLFETPLSDLYSYADIALFFYCFKNESFAN